MELRDLTDAAALMGELADLLPSGSPLRDDFQFFRAINCTTQSEYRQMLRDFLSSLLGDPLPPPLRDFTSRLTRLYRWL